MGVPVSGVLDDYAGRIANWLVGNSRNSALLEMTMIGAAMELLCEADIAITGAAMHPQINGQPCQMWTSLRMRPGDVLSLGAAENGCRAYLAITGGVEVPVVLGSRSTYLGGQLGGLNGQMLAAGDILKRGAGTLLRAPKRLPWFPLYPENICLRAMAGPHDGYFQDHLQDFFQATFKVTTDCNRMGIRLSGPTIDRDAAAPASIISEPIVPGNVQMPANGQPIVLMKEQTVGGYTNIATVVSSDIWRLGQAKPDDTIRFRQISLEEAHLLCREWAGFLAAAKHIIFSL